MERTLFSFVAQAQRRPVAVRCEKRRSDQLRLTADDKRALEHMVDVELRRGWVLVSRSFSLDDGHGATLVRKEISKAA